MRVKRELWRRTMAMTRSSTSARLAALLREKKWQAKRKELRCERERERV